MTSDCPFGVCLLLYYLFFGLWHLIAPFVSFCYCIICSSLVYGIWLPLWYLSVIVLFVLFRFTAYDCPFDVFLLLYYLFFFGVWHLIAPLVSFCYWIICSSLVRFYRDNHFVDKIKVDDVWTYYDNSHEQLYYFDDDLARAKLSSCYYIKRRQNQ